MDIEQQLQVNNIAAELDKDKLYEIGCTTWQGYDSDKESRKEWEERNEDYIKLASQVIENKSFPWQGASNVKYPLLSIACLQFASRAYSQLFPDQNVVKGKVIGYDPNGQKRDAAERVSKHMSYQLLEEMEDWSEEMDRGLLVLPICGNIFKKTYRGYDKNVSEVVLPNDLVINYYAKSIENASRKSHVLYYYPREIEEHFRSGLWERPEKPFGKAPSTVTHPVSGDTQGVQPPTEDPDAPHKFIEQHTYYDLDDDGYAEPMIITIHEETKQVVRMVPGFEEDDITYNGDEIVRIKATEYFTNFIFIPDVTSGVYGQGFGNLLGPLNKIANSIFNRILDAGTLSNLPIGFLNRGVRAARGQMGFRPGEFKPLENVPGNDINKAVYQLKLPEPSRVLLEMLGMTLDSGQQLSTVSKMMSGESPGQNQPYKTTSDLLHQGQQVFNTIYKRIHKALKKEFRKLFKLNQKYVGEQEYFQILDTDIKQQGAVLRTDYQNDESGSPLMNIVPASDPSVITNQEEMEKSAELMAFVKLGTVNPIEATRRRLLARGEEDIQALMTMPPPQPNPEFELKKMELQIREKEVSGNLQLQAFKNQFQALRDQSAVQKVKYEASLEEQRIQIDRFKAENQAIKDSTNHQLKELQMQMKGLLERYKIDKEDKSEDKNEK